MSTKMMSVTGSLAVFLGTALLLTAVPMTLHNAAVIGGAIVLVHFGAYQRFLARVPAMLQKAKEMVK